MSKSPTYKKFIPMSGYKDVFYNPHDDSINKPLNNSIIKNNDKYAKRKNNLRIDIDVQDCSHPKNNVKSNIVDDTNIFNSLSNISNPVLSYRQNILNKRNLNSKKSIFEFPPTSTESATNKTENLPTIKI